MARTRIVAFRVDENAGRMLHAVAKAERMTLSSWLRRLAVRRASELERAGIHPEPQQDTAA